MKVSVRFFAVYRERAGTSQVDIDLPDGATAKDLLARLHTKYTSLPVTDSVLIAVNSEYVRPEAPLHEGDEVVFVPPVSGGEA